MLKYYDNPWKDPVTYAVAGGCICGYALCATAMHCHPRGEWEKIFGNVKYLAHLIWIGIYVSFCFSTLLAYRAIIYQGDVLGNELGIEDSKRLIAVFVINLALLSLYAWAYFYINHKLIGIIFTLSLLVGSGYQAGLTAKWGKIDGNSLSNLKGATWLMSPMFLSISIGALYLHLAIGSSRGENKIV